MPSTHFLSVVFSVLSFLALFANAGRGLPDKIYGVNLGSWLLIEPWMLPAEWVRMGGQTCTDCSTCIASEFAFTQAHPETADAKFKEHWQTWFTQKDVDEIKAAGLNTVRLPLGYWIIEALVDRSKEFYPRGGIHELVRGMKLLEDAGISVILDHHALPGVASPNQMFAGRCTTDVQFYTPYNYHRALIWTAVMTAISHLHPNFSPVGALHAANEPIMDANQTPGYGEFQKNFVRTVRAVEISLGIPSVPNFPLSSLPILSTSANVTSVFINIATSIAGSTSPPTPLASIFTPEVVSALRDAAPILLNLANELKINTAFGLGGLRTFLSKRTPLTTNFMDVTWQRNNAPNPADAAIGPQNYDNHIYYSFGGVAEANEEAYLKHVCNLDRIATASSKGNSPLFFGEWSLATQFNATDEFLRRWGDAQKYSYSKGAGWIFWNFKIENSAEAKQTARQWDYLEGRRRGYFSGHAEELFDPNVCRPYLSNA